MQPLQFLESLSDTRYGSDVPSLRSLDLGVSDAQLATRSDLALSDLRIAFRETLVPAAATADLHAGVESAAALPYVACRRVLVPNASAVEDPSGASGARTAAEERGAQYGSHDHERGVGPSWFHLPPLEDLDAADAALLQRD